MEWAFHLLQRLREVTTHSPSRSVSTFLCSRAGMRSLFGHFLCLCYTAARCTECPLIFQAELLSATSGSRLSGRTVVGIAGGKRCMFTAGQAVRCGQDTDHCHFIIYRRVCTVSGAQLLSGVRLFAILWTVACQAPLSVEFSRQNTGVGCCFLLQGIFLTQRLNPHLLNWQADSLLLSYWGNPIYGYNYLNAEFSSYSSFMVLADVVTIFT